MHWSGNPIHLVSVSQDGRMLTWDALSTNKTNTIALNTYVMSCAYSPTGNFVSTGGLTNKCSIYNLEKEPENMLCRDLNGHDGFVSGCRFLNNDKQIITGSGDHTCILWDLEQANPIKTFAEHEGDIMGIALAPDESHFVSCSIDTSSILWDVRAGKYQWKFKGHENDINAISYMRSGCGFGTASDDSTLRMFDIRAGREMIVFNSEDISCGVTSVDFSVSGRFIFGGYDDYNCVMWETLTGEVVHTLKGHDERVTTVGVNSDGTALCTGGWDCILKIWA